MEPEFYPLFILIAMVTIWCTMIFLMILNQFIGPTNINAKRPIKNVRYLSIVSLLSFIICLLAEIAILNALDSKYSIPKHEIYLQIIHTARRASWTCGQLFIFIIHSETRYYKFQNQCFCFYIF
eukprot:224081_1